MFLYFWYFGVLLKFLVSGRLIIKEWCRHLPCFSAFVFLCTMKSLFLIPLYGTVLYGDIQRITSPWIACLQVAAALEAFVIFASWVPKFRRLGIAAVLVSIGIAIALVQWTAPEDKAALSVAATAALERGTGLGVSIVLAIAMLSYGLFDKGQPRAAYWHACCLALLSLSNAVGWQMIQQRVPSVYPIWTMVLGGVIPFMGWLLIVKESPTSWKVSLPKAIDRKGIQWNGSPAPTPRVSSLN